MQFYNELSLIITSILSAVTIVCFFKDGEKRSVPSAVSNPVYFFALFFIFIFLISVRLYQFGVVPGGINQDEALSAIDGYYLFNYGTDHLGTEYPVHMAAWEYGQQSALLAYLIAFFIRLFGMSIWAVRLPLLVFSVIGALFFVLFVKDVFEDRTVVLIAAFLIAINPWHFIQSRWSLDCNLFPHILITGIYLLNHGLSLSKNRNLLIAISMLFFGLSMYTYGITIYTIPLFLLLTGISLLVKKQINIRSFIIAIVSYLFIAWPFILCMAVNALGLDSVSFLCFTIPFFPLSVRSGDILFFSDNIPRIAVRNFVYFLRAAFLQIDGPCYQPWNEVDGFGTLYLFSLPFVVAGIVALLKKFKSVSQSGNIILACYFITCIICGIVTNSVNINRINIVYYLVIFLCAAGISSVFDMIPFSRPVIPLLYIASAFLLFNTYFGQYASNIQTEFKKDLGDAFCYAMDNTENELFVVCNDKTGDILSPTEVICRYYELERKSKTADTRDVFYKDLEKCDISPEVVYVIPHLYAVNFDSNSYDLIQFGSYYAVIPDMS